MTKIKISYFHFFLYLIICLFQLSYGQTITTVAGNGGAGFTGDGVQAVTTELKYPSDVAVDLSGNIYIADMNNSRIRKVNTSGIISTIAGNGSFGFSGDGGIAGAAQINAPSGIALDGSGNIYIADTYNHRIRKISSTGTITTIAGNGTAGYGGDGGAAISCSLYYPWAVKVDASGNVFIADYGNNRIRKISTTGTITTIAGNGTAGFSGDGGAATSAQLNSPQGIALDASGNIFISDKQNNRIRKVNSFGIISTYAGSGNQGYYGNNIPAINANLNNPLGIATDAAGNVYIADYYNNLIRRISTSGIISDVVGSGVPGFFGDGGPVLSAQIYQPWGVGTDAAGNLWVADTYNNRVRAVNSSVLGLNEMNQGKDLIIAPNPVIDFLNVESRSSSKIIITNVLGIIILQEEGFSGNNKIDFCNLPNGIYFVECKTESGGSIKRKVIKQ